MRTARILIVCGLVAGVVAAEARAAVKRAPLLEAVTQCRAIGDDKARLACFDTSVAQLDDAEKKQDVVVVDREEIKATRRSLFGLTLPPLSLFAGKEGKSEVVTEIDAKVASVTTTSDGSLIITLDDGARWHQMDATVLPRTPRPGDEIRIKRGLMGSYQMSIRSIIIRVKREN